MSADPAGFPESPTLPAQTGSLLVRPGDVLIIAMNSPVSMAMAANIQAGVKQVLPGLKDVVIIDSAAAIAAYRPGGEAT